MKSRVDRNTGEDGTRTRWETGRTEYIICHIDEENLKSLAG